MKKEYLSLFFATLLAAILCTGFVSCGGDDDETDEPTAVLDKLTKLQGTLRQYDPPVEIINTPIRVYVPGNNGVAETGHYEVIDNYVFLPMSVLVFNKDNTVYKYLVGRKKTAEFLNKQENFAKYTWTDFKGYPDWCYFNNGESENPKKLNYQVNTETMTVTLSNGETYHLHYMDKTYELHSLSDNSNTLKFILWDPADNSFVKD